MQAKDDITGELNGLRFPYLDRSLPQFQVPEAYFESFPQRVLGRLAEADEFGEASGSASGLPVADRSRLPFSLPAGYFSGFAARVLEELSPGPDRHAPGSPTGKRHPFKLPDPRYFETFESLLMGRIRLMGSEKDREAVSPVLAALKHKNVYEVPEGYFREELPKPPVQKPLIVTHPAQRSIKWSSWMAAAGILLIFTLGARGLFSGSSGPDGVSDSGYEVVLSEIPEQEIAEYLEMTMNEYELAGFYADNALLQHAGGEQAPRELLNSIPIEDIEAYLDGGGI